jgi:hypothetical protein
MSDNAIKFQIGSLLYTQAEIDAINNEYGERFLQMNPHFPAPGMYKYADGTETVPFAINKMTRNRAPDRPAMNILVVANHYAVCSARYATAAFARLGHSVKHIGPAMGRDIWGLTLPPEYVWEPECSLSDYSKLKHIHPDVTIVMDSDPAILDWAGNAAYFQNTITWGVDNHVRDYRRPDLAHYFLAHSNVSHMKLGLGAGPTFVPFEEITHLPCCYDPTLHTPSPIPFEEREYDVCMIGVMYPQRWTLVKALHEAGFKVLAGTGLVGENYVKAYHNARIALNISSNGDVAQRVFETAATGNVVMTDRCPDFRILKPEGFWLLDDTEPETVVQACKDILHEPERAQNMVKLSQTWGKGHTWDARAKRIIEWADAR